MKAIVYTKYGPPDVLQLKEVEKPTPKDNEVLIKIHAASVNPLDWHISGAKPFLVRLDQGLLKPKNNTLGADIAGRVEAVGKNIKLFQPGDEVFGDIFNGGFAEYVCVTEDKLVQKPGNISFEEAAAVPVAALTALQGLRDIGQIQSGQKVLVNGASGGVGTFTVQIAKSFGTEVTGVCSTRNLNMVRSIGADHVIDYTQEDFTRIGQSYDLIYDAVGNRTVSDLKRTLSPKGICAVMGFTSLGLMFQVMLMGPLVSMTSNKKFGTMVTKANQKDMLFLASLLETGKIKPVIDRRYTLNEVPEALRYLEKGHARGKVVITLEHKNSNKHL
jgi:NADPH:quinone reductase-like Zn-dependent oxidoreductase